MLVQLSSRRARKTPAREKERERERRRTRNTRPPPKSVARTDDEEATVAFSRPSLTDAARRDEEALAHALTRAHARAPSSVTSIGRSVGRYPLARGHTRGGYSSPTWRGPMAGGLADRYDDVSMAGLAPRRLAAACTHTRAGEENLRGTRCCARARARRQRRRGEKKKTHRGTHRGSLLVAKHSRQTAATTHGYVARRGLRRVRDCSAMIGRGRRRRQERRRTRAVPHVTVPHHTLAVDSRFGSIRRRFRFVAVYRRVRLPDSASIERSPCSSDAVTRTARTELERRETFVARSELRLDGERRCFISLA